MTQYSDIDAGLIDQPSGGFSDLQMPGVGDDLYDKADQLLELGSNYTHILSNANQNVQDVIGIAYLIAGEWPKPLMEYDQDQRNRLLAVNKSVASSLDYARNVADGAANHLSALKEFRDSDAFGSLSPDYRAAIDATIVTLEKDLKENLASLMAKETNFKRNFQRPVFHKDYSGTAHRPD